MAIQASVEQDALEITVMDNGTGMTPERLEYVQQVLESHETETHVKSRRASIGSKTYMTGSG